MKTLMFYIQIGLNLTASLILIVGGILLFFLASALPTALPFNVLVSIVPGELIATGLLLILLALVPLYTSVSRVVDRRKKKSDLEDGSLELLAEEATIHSGFAPGNLETVWYKQEEAIVQLVVVPQQDRGDLHDFYFKLPPIGHIQFPS
jgi:membrane protein implicated in regulation of membrane protease activity